MEGTSPNRRVTLSNKLEEAFRSMTDDQKRMSFSMNSKNVITS